MLRVDWLWRDRTFIRELEMHATSSTVLRPASSSRARTVRAPPLGSRILVAGTRSRQRSAESPARLSRAAPSARINAGPSDPYIAVWCLAAGVGNTQVRHQASRQGPKLLARCGASTARGCGARLTEGQAILEQVIAIGAMRVYAQVEHRESSTIGANIYTLYGQRLSSRFGRSAARMRVLSTSDARQDLSDIIGVMSCLNCQINS
jgi:hypothetical protein